MYLTQQNCSVHAFLCVLSFELVKSMLPVEFHKVLANIRKVEARNKRHKLLDKTEEDGSDSEENNPKTKTDRCSRWSLHVVCLDAKMHNLLTSLKTKKF